jgi:hypothetical protein
MILDEIPFDSRREASQTLDGVCEEWTNFVRGRGESSGIRTNSNRGLATFGIEGSSLENRECSVISARPRERPPYFAQIA